MKAPGKTSLKHYCKNGRLSKLRVEQIEAFGRQRRVTMTSGMALSVQESVSDPGIIVEPTRRLANIKSVLLSSVSLTADGRTENGTSYPIMAPYPVCKLSL